MAKGDVHDLRVYAQIQFRETPDGGIKLRYGDRPGADGKLQGSTTHLVSCSTRGELVQFTTASGSRYICSLKQVRNIRLGLSARMKVTAALPALAGCW